MTNSTQIDIKIVSDESSARVTITKPDRTQSLKTIPLKELPNLIRDSSSNFTKDYDTGFISTSLIRESIANGQTRRLYLYPTITFDCNYDTGLDANLRTDNKYGFIHNHGRLFIPNYTLRNFGLFIVNTNDEDFNCVRHNFGCLSTNFFDMPDNNSQLYTSFLNHFDTSVCWHHSFSRSLLDERNTLLQGQLPYNYLTSIFNNDLGINSSISQDVITKYRAEDLEDYLNDIFRVSDMDDLIEELLNSRSGFIILQYYFATLKKLKFEEYTNPYRGVHIQEVM